MDKFDRIILSELSTDCRQALSSIGKKIKRSPQFVKYRLEQLKQNTIKQIPYILDFYKLGFFEVSALISFPIIDPLTEKTFVDFLFKRKETYKLFSVSGINSIFCSFVVKDFSELNELKKSMLEIANFDIDFLVNYQTNIYAHNYLSEHSSKKKIVLKQTSNVEAMNPLLRQVLVELQQSPFISNLEISQKIEETYDKVSYALKNNDLLLGNSLLFSNKTSDKAFIFLKVNDLQKLSSYCDLQKNIIELNFLTASFDAIISLETDSNLKQTIKQILFELKDIIQKHVVLEQNNVYKYGWYL